MLRDISINEKKFRAEVGGIIIITNKAGIKPLMIIQLLGTNRITLLNLKTGNEFCHSSCDYPVLENATNVNDLCKNILDLPITPQDTITYVGSDYNMTLNKNN